MTLAVGAKLGPYEILAPLGAGGMGEVYRARDIRLGREIAIKLVHPRLAADPERHSRFEKEARAAAQLDHHNILVIHDVGTHEGSPFIVSELLQGESLREKLGAPLPPKKAVGYAIQIAHGLAAAHEKGIVHRDIKPENVFVTKDGHVKILDFGLAKLLPSFEASGVDTETPTEIATQPGTALGTVAYMSPEQIRGQAVDARSDLFSLGGVLYEMLSGKRPFQRGTVADTMSAILHEEPPVLTGVGQSIPPVLDKIVRHCLEKDVSVRTQSARDVIFALETLSTLSGEAPVRVESPEKLPRHTVLPIAPRSWPRPRKLIPVAAAVVVVGALGYLAGTSIHQNRRARWAREVALPEVKRLVGKNDWPSAYPIAVEAEKYIEKDPALAEVFADVAILLSVKTEPPGASVFLRPYAQANRNWELNGQTPIEARRISRGFKEYRITRDGYDEVTGFTGSDQRLPPAQGARIRVERTLGRAGTTPPAMVRVDGGKYKPTILYFRRLEEVDLDPFLIDRFETTNRQYQAFVDAGGYREKKYWSHEFVKDGRTLSWEESLAGFTDKTGRNGPASWELARFPEGQADYPVSGISWYEAAAYAAFAGKSLPTVYHWNKAAGVRDLEANEPNTSMIQPVIMNSNFGFSGPAPVGRFRGISPYGAFDMAGNVKEWIWNGAPGGRYLLGGSWGVPEYLFYESAELLSPFDRSPANGFRCVKLTGIHPLPAATMADVPRKRPDSDFQFAKPVPDDVFRIYRSYYAYDKTALEPLVEAPDGSSPYHIRQRVTFNTAYGGERAVAYLFLPKNAKPPFQTVVIFPGGGAMELNSIDAYSSINIAMFTRSGRAVVFPVYKGTFERPRVDSSTPTRQRDFRIMVYKDFARTLDYLETRPEIDSGRLAYSGLSWGASMAPIFGALEKRIKLFLLEGGGLVGHPLPEVAPVNFAPRHTAPTVIFNGRHDILFPVEVSAKPLLELLGTPSQDKALILFDGGHVPPMDSKLIKAVLDWLDRYLGPVR